MDRANVEGRTPVFFPTVLVHKEEHKQGTNTVFGVFYFEKQRQSKGDKMSIAGTILKIGGKLLFGKVAKKTGEDETVVEKVLTSAGEVIQQSKTLRGMELEIARNFFGLPKDAHLVIQILQSVVRPVVTLAYTALLIHNFYYHITIDPQLFYIGSGVTLAWFVPRPFEKIGKFKKVAKLLSNGGK